jgi:hypothetical protein
MILSQNELGSVFFALNMSKGGEPRKFAFSELAKVNGIAAKIDKFPEDGKLTKPEYEVDFSTEEKVFLMEKVKEHDWSVGDSKVILSLVEKLS